MDNCTKEEKLARMIIEMLYESLDKQTEILRESGITFEAEDLCSSSSVASFMKELLYILTGSISDENQAIRVLKSSLTVPTEYAENVESAINQIHVMQKIRELEEAREAKQQVIEKLQKEIVGITQTLDDLKKGEYDGR